MSQSPGNGLCVANQKLLFIFWTLSFSLYTYMLNFYLQKQISYNNYAFIAMFISKLYKHVRSLYFKTNF
jgi:hypothetical protein